MGKKERSREKKQKRAEVNSYHQKQLRDYVLAGSVLRSYEMPPDAGAVDWTMLDYGQYGDHTKLRPYKTIGEGVEWYMMEAPGVPDFMYIPLVAKNFNLTEKEAKTKLVNEISKTSVDLS